MKNKIYIVLCAILFLAFSCKRGNENAKVIVYGGTPAGVIAAVTAARNGADVLLIEQTSHLGGLNTSGLITAESEHMINTSITGVAREFYVRMGAYFPEAYFKTFYDGKQLKFREGDPAFFFESHIAEKVFNAMIAESGVTVMYNRFVSKAVKRGKMIDHILLDNGNKVIGARYIDASYEGDLMARAGVSYTYGREGQDHYDESYAGVRFMDDTLAGTTVDTSGKRLGYFNSRDGLAPGTGDSLVMNYNFRPTMTKDSNNFYSVQKPVDYDAAQFKILGEYLAKFPDTRLNQLIGIYPRGNGKYEFNNQQKAIISLGLFGGNATYPEADYKERSRIYDTHKSYTLGFLYFLGHDPSVPKKLRDEMGSFGFCKDEFTDNDHFPYYLYIREARRMIGDSVMTQDDILVSRVKEDAVALGSHWIDSHHVQRVALTDSTYTNEGRIWHKVTAPYELPYSVLLPKQAECENLLVPVCASVSHVAFCSYRLESTWMQMGHVSGTAAALSLKSNTAVQEIPTIALQNRLEKEGMILKIKDLGTYEDYKDE